MPTYEDTRQVEISARPEDCFAVLTDYEHLPDWQSRICECKVLERDEQGRGSVVEYAIDAKLRVVRYRLRHTYEEPTEIASEYLEGDFKHFAGDYQFRGDEGSTEVEFRLRIDPGFTVPGRIARMLGQAVMGRSLQDLKKRVEDVADGPQ